MAYIYDLSDQWTAAGTTFTAIKMSVTDTASAAGSLLMDLQVGGSSKFKVDKAGDASINPTGFSGPYTLRIGDAGTVQAYGSAFGTQPLIVNYSGGLSIANNTGSLRLGSSSDVLLARDAANTLAQRNGVNPQAFNLYNTYTDASNYERGFMRFVSSVLQIGTEKLGTGTARALVFQTDGVTRMTVGVGGTVSLGSLEAGSGSIAVTSGLNTVLWNGGILGWTSAFSANASSTPDTAFTRAGVNIVGVTNGSTGGGAMQMVEMTAPAAPAANGVRIYAVDNGSGKTQLMALFATGAAVQIAIEP